MLAASQGAQAHSLTRSRACWSQPALDGGRLARRGLLRAGVAHRPAWRGTAGSGGGAGAYQPWQPQLPPTEASLTEVLQQMSDDIESIKNDQSAMKSDVNKLKSDVQRIKATVTPNAWSTIGKGLQALVAFAIFIVLLLMYRKMP